MGDTASEPGVPACNPVRPEEAATGVDALDDATAPCRHCLLPIKTGAQICQHCQQWQVARQRSPEQWLSVAGAIIGFGSTLVLIGSQVLDRLVPPTAALEVLENPVCRASGCVVMIKNNGRGAGFAPQQASESMSFYNQEGVRLDNESDEQFGGTDSSLRLAQTRSIAPHAIEEVSYVPEIENDEIREGQGRNCRRAIKVGQLNKVYSKCELK